MGTPDAIIARAGDKTTYKYNGTTRPACTIVSPNGEILNDKFNETVMFDFTDGFWYYDGKKFVKADLSKTEGIITTLETTWYNYSCIELERALTESDAFLFGIELEEMTGGHDYWLASPWILADVGFVNFGMHAMHEVQVLGDTLWGADGTKSVPVEHGVRAVVSLAPNIQVNETKDGGWTF